MRILIGCEYSGTLRDAFIKRGHDAISCDLLPTDMPGPHYQGDIFNIIDGAWDLAVFFPPCTFLCNSGVCHLYNKDKTKNLQRWKDMKEGALFFKRLLNANIPKIAIENPIMHGYAREIIGVKYSQIVHPWQFGHEASKSTCLWLKNLPLLKPTKIVGKGEFITHKSGVRKPKWFADALSLSPLERMKVRSKTFQGIADSMADTWGTY